MKTKIILLLLFAFGFGHAQSIKTKPKSEEKTIQVEKPRAQSSDQKKIDPAIRKPEGIKPTEKKESEFVNLVSVPVTFPAKGMKRVYNVRVKLFNIIYTKGDEKNERIGFDLYGDLFVAGVGKGKKRILCANQNGNNGCRHTIPMYLGESVSFFDTMEGQEWEVNLTKDQLANAQLEFGTDYLGFYEKRLYSDKISKGYNRKLVIKLNTVRREDWDGKSLYSYIHFTADLRNQEVVFSGVISLEAKDILK